MKAGGGKRKGGNFELEMSKALSCWWTNQEREDVYRRSATSGGQATVRSKKGKTTSGQYGDIAIADPIGQPLLDLATIECKDGYPGQSPFDLIDKSSGKNCKYGEFFEQCLRESQEAKTPFWILIAKRKSRQKMIYFPLALYKLINKKCGLDHAGGVRLSFVDTDGIARYIYGTQLSQFFCRVPVEAIKEISQSLKGFYND